MVQIQSEDAGAALFATDVTGRAYVCDPHKGGVQEVTLASYLGSHDQCPALNDLERAAGEHDAAKTVHDTAIVKTAPMFLRDVVQGGSSPRLLVLDHDGLGQVLSTRTWDVRAVWLPPHGVGWAAPFVLEMIVKREQLIVAWDGAENVSGRLRVGRWPCDSPFLSTIRRCLLSGRSSLPNSGTMGGWRCNCKRRCDYVKARCSGPVSRGIMAWSWAVQCSRRWHPRCLRKRTTP